MLKFSAYHLSIISLFQVVSQFSNFLKPTDDDDDDDDDDDQRGLVGLRRAAPQAKITISNQRMNQIGKLRRISGLNARNQAPNLAPILTGASALDGRVRPALYCNGVGRMRTKPDTRGTLLDRLTFGILPCVPRRTKEGPRRTASPQRLRAYLYTYSTDCFSRLCAPV